MSAEFTDPIRDQVCVLIAPPGGKVFPLPGELKIGIGHAGCEELADLSVDLDAFYCPACKYNGRVSGQWCIDMIGGETPVSDRGHAGLPVPARDVIIVNASTVEPGRMVIDVRENHATQYMILTRRAVRSLRNTLAALDLGDDDVTADVPVPAGHLDAEAEFLAASVAVWREIDRLDAEPDGYHPIRMSVELRQRERAAWERYRDHLDAVAAGRGAADGPA